MKIIKIITLACIPATLFGLLLISSCASEEEEIPITLKDKIQGKSYVLGSVTKGGTNVTSEFTGFKITFSPTATLVSIVSGGGNSANCQVSAVVAGNQIGLIGATCFQTSVLNNVSTNGDGSTLKFDCTLPSSSIVITPGGRTSGTSDYTFDLVRQ
ncbi:MAG: hypothetical protein ACK5TU_11155 [Cyclobacteriaceae bacterium]